MSLTALDGRWLRVNRALCDITGYSADELLTMTFRDITHPHDLVENLEALRRLVTGEIPSYHFQKRYLHKLGHVVWVRIDQTIVCDASGEPRGLVAQIQDITARRQAEATLRRRDAILAAVASSAERLLQASDWRNVVDEVLADLGAAATAGRAYVFENHEDGAGNPVVSQRYEWCAPGIAHQPDNAALQCFPLATPGYEEWFARIAGGGAVQANVRDFPDGVGEHHLEEDIRAVLVVPIFVDQSWWGFIGFDECVAEREWSPAEVEALRAAAGTIGAAIQRERAAARYRSLVEHLPLTTYIDNLDDAASSIYVSPQIEAMLGYTPEEWLADPGFFAKVLHPDDRATALEEEWPADDGPHRAEYRLIARDGQIVDVLDEYMIVRDGAGRRLYAQGYMLDVTELKRAEEALRRSEEEFRAVFETSLDAIVVLDDEGRCVDANPAACALYGVERNELIGLESGMFSESREVARSTWSRLRAMDTAGGECTLVRRDGERREVEFRWRAGFLPGRHLTVYRDVTERKALENRLLQSQKLEAVGQLAGGIAHDFNNLLAAITGYGEFLLAGLEPDDPLHRDAQEITRAAERAAGLVQQLLAFGRRQILRPQVIDLNEVVAEIEPMLQALVGEEVELVTRLEPELERVSADPGQIEQMVVSLAVNARDAMPDGGTLTIQTAHAEEGVTLAVSDTGTGMDEETRRRAFEPFFTTKEQGKGTGLGLSTVYGIVTQSGGRIEVESEPGRGTTFRLFLPAAGDPGPAG